MLFYLHATCIFKVILNLMQIHWIFIDILRAAQQGIQFGHIIYCMHAIFELLRSFTCVPVRVSQISVVVLHCAVIFRNKTMLKHGFYVTRHPSWRRNYWCPKRFDSGSSEIGACCWESNVDKSFFICFSDSPLQQEVKFGPEELKMSNIKWWMEGSSSI